MKRTTLVATLAAAVCMSTSAWSADKDHAHDVKPMYGGVVAAVSDINYELVLKPDSATIYVSDHGKPVDVKNGTATLTLLSGTDKTDAKLNGAGANKLEAKGSFKAAPGTKAAATVTLPGQPPRSMRWTIK